VGVIIQIQLRRDVAADWTSANPVLADGEMGLETDTNKFKIGDGTTAWSSLPYGGIAGAAGAAGASGAQGPMGFEGEQGESGFTIPGPTGTAGPQGEPGVGGHTIADAGTPETQRATLDFQDGFIVTDNPGAASTDVDIDTAAIDHGGLAGLADDDHTQYRLESADHSHASTGLEAGTVSHDVLTGVSADDHHAQAHSGADHTDPAAATTVDIGDTAAAGTGTNPPAADDHVHGFPAPAAAYPLDTTFAAEADGTATTPARSDHRHTITDPTDLPANDVVGTTTGTEGASTQVARANHAHGITAYRFSVGGLLDGAGASPATGFRMVWRAPFACTVVEIQGHVDAGTTTTVNARLNQTSDFLAADLAIAAANAWSTSSTIQNAAVAIDDDIEIEVVNAGTATKITIQVELTRP